MFFSEKNRIKFTETILRDAHQSLMATRMKTADMLPIAEVLDEVEAKVRAAYGLDSGLPSGDPEGAQAEVPGGNDGE